MLYFYISIFIFYFILFYIYIFLRSPLQNNAHVFSGIASFFCRLTTKNLNSLVINLERLLLLFEVSINSILIAFLMNDLVC